MTPIFKGKSKEEKEIEREIRHRKARVTLQHYLEKLENLQTMVYNQGKQAAKLGDDKFVTRQAAKYLRLSVEAGFVDIDHIRNDPDFLKVNDSPHFQKVLDRIGKEISKKNRKNDQSAPESTFTDNSNKVQTEPASGASATVSYGPMN